MLSNPVFLAEKDKLWGHPFIMLVEFDYVDDVNTPQKIRLAQYTQAVTYGGAEYLPAPIGEIQTSQNMQLEIPAFDIAIANSGNSLDALVEYYDVIGSTGRILLVHVDHLADPTHHETEAFTIVQAAVDAKILAFTVSPIGFDPLDTLIPAKRITRKEFPGVAINRNLSR